MIEKIKKIDGTIIDFDLVKTIESISYSLEKQGNLSAAEAHEMAKNIIELISEKFISSIPSTTDFETLVGLVLNSTTPSNDNSNLEQDLDPEGYNTSSVYTENDPISQQEVIEINSDIKNLQDNEIYYSEQTERILVESASFDELGRSIFLDRYSVKDKRDNIERGDLVIAISKEDPKYPKKDLGVVKSIVGDKITLHMITGLYADNENNFEFTQSIWKCDKPLESIRDAHKRVATSIASVEKTPELQDQWSKEFLDQLQSKHIQPAGRIMTGPSLGEDAYTKNLTLFNCYVIPSPKDSRRSIISDTLHQMTEIMSRGGGVGINISSLRPRYAYVRGVHGKSSGAVSWGGLFSYGTGLIELGGSRRGALMLMIHDWHPDVEEFINSKRKRGMIENANISVLVSDKFMGALANGEMWDLEFPEYESEDMSEIYDKEWDGNLDLWKQKGYPTKVYKTIDPRELWDQIVSSAHASAEPGIVFMERYNKMSNSYYFNPIICTNPCGEQGLPGWGVCNLGHLYLASFLDRVGEDEQGALYEVNWSELKKSASVLTRFLDNVIDKTPYHFEENETNQKGERRVGGGTLGLGEMLIKLRLRYGSAESIELINQVYKVICDEMYKASSDIAAEKGSFPMFEADKFLESGFCRNLPEDLKQQIREKGMRNVTLTTQAPTGTVGTMLGTSTGIEPYYAFEFYRQSRLGFHKVKIPLAENYISEDGLLPDYFVTAMEMSPSDHIRVQAAVQKWTDSSISKTANAPENFTIEETKQLYEEAYRLGCKGVTIYRDNSRSEQILSTDENTENKNISESIPDNIEPILDQQDNQEEAMLEGSSCTLKVDENGQMFKSCSD